MPTASDFERMLRGGVPACDAPSGVVVGCGQAGRLADGAVDGFTIDEAEVVYRGRCPDCSTATSS